MFTHIDQFRSLFDEPESRFDYRFGFSDKGDYGSVGALTGIDIQEFYTFNRLNDTGNGIDFRSVSSF
jgi:hypothetical protein